MAIQIKDNFKTIGGITTSGAISTSGNGSHSIGSTANRFNSIIGTNVYAYDANAQHMASLRTTTTGTTDTVGVGRLVAGNNVESGTAGNAKGQVLLYGTSTGYTTITPGNNSASSVTLTLPSATGSIPLMGKGDTSYWGLTPPDGGSGWIRTTSSGILPNSNGSGALGTSSWQFSSIYGKAIYEDGTALSSKYAPYSHTHSYLPLAGGTMTGPIKSSSMATTWVAAAKGNAIINSTLTPGSFSPIASAGTTNGRMTLAWYNAELNVAYLTKANCDSSTNTVAHLGTLMNESGGAYWPGTIGASRLELTGVGPQLTLKATQSNNYATIQFLNSSSASMGYVGMSAVNGGLYRWKADASQARAIVDEDTWSWALPFPTSGNYWNGLIKVNGDGVMEIGKYLDFHNTNGTTKDYSTRLQSCDDLGNVVYLPTGSGDLGTMHKVNGYWGIATPQANQSDWIRTTVNGMIPYQSGGASSLGTDSWPFNNVWTNRINGVNTTNFFHSGNNVINVADRSSGDSGFGNSSRAVGFIGRFPGWDSNCVYINTYNGGGETKSYDHVKIKGSYVYLDGNIYIQGTPVSVQSSAPGCGGVWIQI